ncbi:MAG: Uma2 family endonuclease [Candidatus Tectomicrobia bacterium]|uniref:Uma2 family endonuclease n=1 Tax=Tectimicrobiota bacterium TaxID=2528274 RepID=A0A937W6U5_UNCTE|nr:Uma2 family endonuclease [Candidatus Tectomicrobia bacterium]
MLYPQSKKVAGTVRPLERGVEVLSEGNTPAEMTRKRQEYFTAGVQLVWFVDPQRRTVTSILL